MKNLLLLETHVAPRERSNFYFFISYRANKMSGKMYVYLHMICRHIELLV